MPPPNSLKFIVDFIDKEPDFSFNLAEHVGAVRHASALAQRREEFVRWVESGGGSKKLQWSDVWEAVRGELGDVPHFQRALADGVTSGEQLDPVSKADLRANIAEFLNPRLDASMFWRKTTSGSSGTPTSVYFTAEATYEYRETAPRLLKLAGLQELANETVGLMIIQENKNLPNRIWSAPISQAVTLRYILDEEKGETVSRIAQLIERYSPRVLSVKPNTLELLMRQSYFDSGCLSQFAAIISSGAMLGDDLKKEVEDQIGVPVINFYGLSEIQGVASTCSANTFHVHANDLIAEVRANDGRICSSGDGELVVTRVSNAAMPLIRYRTGDHVRLRHGACTCGLSSPVLESLTGRILRDFQLPSGRNISPIRFNRLFDILAIKEFRLSQLSHENFLLELDPASEWSDAQSSAEFEKARFALREGMGEEVQIDLAVKSLPAYPKLQRYVTQLP